MNFLFRPAVTDRRVLSGIITLMVVFAATVNSVSAADGAVATDGPIATRGIVVCPNAFEPAMAPWIQDRAQLGIDVMMIPPARTSEATRQAVAKAADEQTSFVLLVGDVPDFGTAADKQQIAAFYQNTTVTGRFGSTPTLMTDRPYGDLDNDGLVDLAVGRWPATSPIEVTAAIEKVFQTERCQDFGVWRERVELVGGIGGFGPMIDMAIESVTRSVLTSSLPQSARPGILYASPGHLFFPQQSSFRNAVIKRYGKGCRFWVYAGHGQIQELDHVANAAILDVDSITSLDCQDHRHGIALMLACYTGAMDAPGNDFASHLWRSADGPVAVLAGSRVTMPYGNSQIALAMIDRVYQSRDATLGKVWLETQRTLQRDQTPLTATGKMIDSLAAVITPGGGDLKAEKREHAALYQLIGDPTLQLHPPNEIVIQTDSGLESGEPLMLTFESPISGTATITLDTPLGSSHASDPNERVLASINLACELPGSYSVTFATTTVPTGPVELRVHVAGHDGWATGGKRVLVRPSRLK